MLTTVLALALAATLGGSAPAQEPAPARPPADSRTGTPIDLNAASTSQLETLPGIGAATAARIVEYREKNGGFKKIEELMNVKGIGEKSFLKLKPLVSVGAARPAKS